LGMRIGLIPYQTNLPARLGWSLWLPFKGYPAEQDSSRQDFSRQDAADHSTETSDASR